MSQRVLPILTAIVRRTELETYETTLPKLLSGNGSAVDEIKATQDVREAIQRVQTALGHLELAATAYDEAEAGMDLLVSAALRGTKFEIAEGQGRR